MVGADPLEVLHTVWGYDDFRGDQAAVIERLVAGGDAVGDLGADVPADDLDRAVGGDAGAGDVGLTGVARDERREHLQDVAAVELDGAGAVGRDAAARGHELAGLRGRELDGGVILAGGDGVKAGRELNAGAVDVPGVARDHEVVAGPHVDRQQQRGVVGEGVVHELLLVLERAVLIDGDGLVGAQAIGAALHGERGGQDVGVALEVEVPRQGDDLDAVGRDAVVEDEQAVLVDLQSGLEVGGVGDGDGEVVADIDDVAGDGGIVVAADVALAERARRAGADALAVLAGDALDAVALGDGLHGALGVADDRVVAVAHGAVGLAHGDAAGALDAAARARGLAGEAAEAVAHLGEVAVADDAVRRAGGVGGAGVGAAGLGDQADRRVGARGAGGVGGVRGDGHARGLAVADHRGGRVGGGRVGGGRVGGRRVGGRRVGGGRVGGGRGVGAADAVVAAGGQDEGEGEGQARTIVEKRGTGAEV